MFYQRLHKICKENGTTVTRMVKDLGLSSGNLTNWKNGRLPKTEIALKIANYLNVTVHYLMGEENAPLRFVHGGKEVDRAIENVIDKITLGEQSTKKPLSENEERLKELYDATEGLSDYDIELVKAFVAGLKSNHKND